MEARSRRGRVDVPRLVTPDEIQAAVRKVAGALEQRSYEIYERRGGPAGSEREDWYHAESEMLHPVSVEIRGAAGGMKLRAEVHGFVAPELTICVEARRVTIVGERRAAGLRSRGSVLHAERRGERILRFVDLPGEVNPARTTAALKNGVLELALTAAAPG